MPGQETPPRQLALPGTEGEGTLPPARSPGAPAGSPPDQAAREQALSDEELAHWVAFTRVRGIGPARFGQLLAFFGDATTAWRAGHEALQAAGLDARTSESLLAYRAANPAPLAELERLAKYSVTALPLVDPDYPELLREVYLPPSILYIRGALTPADVWAIAVVGTRQATPYGHQATEMLAHTLAGQQVTVVSGLARGIDTLAHQAALKAGGRTLAVLGCGLDMIYPPENAKLAAQIIERGALLSEFPLGTQPEAPNCQVPEIIEARTG